MSDYIEGLRSDLVEAAARHQDRGTLARRALPVLPRAWSRPALAAALAAAVCAAAIVVAVGTIGPPTRAPAKPHRVASVQLGTGSFDAVYASGSLWVAGTNGDVVRVSHGRVAGRVKIGEQVKSIAAAGGSVWATTLGQVVNGNDGTVRAELVRIDARTGVVTRRFRTVVTDVGPVASGAGGLWWIPDDYYGADVLQRRDPVTGRVVAEIRSKNRFAHWVLEGGTGRLWGVQVDGTVFEVDPGSDRIVATLPNVRQNGVEEQSPALTSLAADGDGVWVAGGAHGDVTLVQAGRVVRRLPVGEGTVSAVARTRDALWVAFAAAGPVPRYRVIRIDPDSGRPTGTVELGGEQPTALTPAGRDLWIVTLGGTATLIR
jgi:hypothetical protein